MSDPNLPDGVTQADADENGGGGWPSGMIPINAQKQSSIPGGVFGVYRVCQKIEGGQTMDRINDGGPAFPGKNENRDHEFHGMALRDWFAGQALNGILRSEEGTDGEPCLGMREGLVYAKECYCMADAMIAEREKDAKP